MKVYENWTENGVDAFERLKKKAYTREEWNVDNAEVMIFDNVDHDVDDTVSNKVATLNFLQLSPISILLCSYRYA